MPPPAKKPRGRPPRVPVNPILPANDDVIEEAPPSAESTALPGSSVENRDVDIVHRVSTGIQTGLDEASSSTGDSVRDEVFEYERSEGIYNNVQENNSYMRLANVLESTLKSVRNASIFNNSNSHLLSRLASKYKPLPVFRGEPLEWLHFKQAFETSTETDAYTDKENISRLFTALQGEAREAVSPLLATGRDADAIMKTLELRFGNKQLLARKLINDIKELPCVNAGKIRLIDFASKLKNAVAALKSLNLVGYLHNADLLQHVGKKIPSALKYSFNKYASENLNDERTEFEKLSNFLINEAEMAMAGGLFEIDTPELQNKMPYNRKPKTNNKEQRVLTGVHSGVSSDNSNIRENSKTCIICRRNNHTAKSCSVLARDIIERKWFLVKKHKLCFKCLNQGHAQQDCKNKNCPKCQKPHNIILHRDARYTNDSRASSSAESAKMSDVCSTNTTPEM